MVERFRSSTKDQKKKKNDNRKGRGKGSGSGRDWKTLEVLVIGGMRLNQKN